MGLGISSPIFNLKGCKVTEKLAFMRLNAWSGITFEPFGLNSWNLGIQCFLPNPISRWKDKKIESKNWSNFDQTWPNFDQFFSDLKWFNKGANVHGKSCFWNFWCIRPNSSTLAKLFSSMTKIFRHWRILTFNFINRKREFVIDEKFSSLTKII